MISPDTALAFVSDWSVVKWAGGFAMVLLFWRLVVGVLEWRAEARIEKLLREILEELKKR